MKRLIYVIAFLALFLSSCEATKITIPKRGSAVYQAKIISIEMVRQGELEQPKDTDWLSVEIEISQNKGGAKPDKNYFLMNTSQSEEIYVGKVVNVKCNYSEYEGQGTQTFSGSCQYIDCLNLP